MKSVKWIICYLIICYCTRTSFSAESGYDVSNTLVDHRILFVSQWDVNETKPFLCIISELPGNSETLPTRTLSFYRREGANIVKIFKFDTPDYPVSIFPMQDVGGRLLTTWTGSSAYHFYVFTYVDGEIKMIFETGSKISPELVLDKDGNDLIIVSDVTWPQGRKDDAVDKIVGISDIYKWNGKHYELIKKVPWKDRFK